MPCELPELPELPALWRPATRGSGRAARRALVALMGVLVGAVAPALADGTGAPSPVLGPTPGSAARPDTSSPVPSAVVARVRRHDDAAALAALDALAPGPRDHVAVRYLRARLYERSGRVLEASDAYATLGPAPEGLPAGLQADLRLRAARIDARAGRAARARPVLLAIAEEGGATRLLALALAAECAATLGEHATAAVELARVLDALGAGAAGRAAPPSGSGGRANTDADAEAPADAREHPSGVDAMGVARLLASSLVALGRAPEAVTRLVAAYVRAPAHPDADAALANAVSLGGRAADLDEAARFAVVARLVAARRYEGALVMLDALGPGGEPRERARRLHLRAETLFAMRTRYADAARAFDEARLLGGPAAAEDEFFAARATARAGRDAEAIGRFDAFVEAHPGDARAREATWLAAWLALRQGGQTATLAQRRMRAFLASASPRTEREKLAQGALAIAMDHLERAEPGRALPWLERACERATTDLDTSRCRYWGATSAMFSGDPEHGGAALRRLAASEPYSWYGLLARRRLMMAGSPEEPGALTRVRSNAPALELPEEVRFLAALGLDDDAARRLRAAEATLRRGPRGLERLAAAYARLGDAARAYRLAREVGDGARASWVLDLEHPEPWADEVAALAPTLGLDPSYVFGTMRQESAFDPSVVSRVGAIGLLQLMPETAARAAERAGIDVFEASMLFDPAMNVRLGMVEMSELSRHYAGSVALVAAAYNAGSAKVDGWTRERPDLPLDLLVERIPFDETRGYVRRVISHTARYRALSGHPERVLTLVENPFSSPVRMR